MTYPTEYTAFGVKRNLKWGEDLGPNAGKTLGSGLHRPSDITGFKRTTDFGFR